MKTLYKEIPLVTKSIIGIAITFFLINIITDLFGIRLNDYLGLYHYTNEKFNLFQIFTFSFMHDTNPLHLIYNILYLLLIGSQCETIIQRDFFKLVLFTIIINIIGIQIIQVDMNYVGLSTIGFSIMTCFLLLKNKLNSVISFSLKLMIALFIFDETFGFLRNITNGIFNFEFHTHYAHILGILSGILFYLYIRYKKRVN